MANYDLVTVQQVKDAIEIPSDSTDLDTLIPEYITQVSSTIMDYCKREFAPAGTVATRRFAVRGYRIDLAPYDLQSATTVTLYPEDSVASTVLVEGTDFILHPIEASRGVYTSLQISGYLVVISQRIMRFGTGLIDINGTWGFPTVPDEVQRACVETVGSWITKTMSGGTMGGYGIPSAAGAATTTFVKDWDIPWNAKKKLDRFKRGSARWPMM